MRTMVPAKDILTAPQLARVRARSNAWGIWLVLHAWLVIAAASIMVAWMPNPLTIALAMMLIGSRQLGLVVLMHEGAHGGLNRSVGVNHALAQWFCAWPMLADVNVYRTYHLKHHANTLTEKDPDVVLTGHYPITRGSLQRKLFRDLTGQSGYAQRKFQILNAFSSEADDQRNIFGERLGNFGRELGPAFFVNGLLFAVFALLGYWWLYLVCWVLPLLTWYQVVLRVRNIAEHAVVRGGTDPFGLARTTLIGWLERMFIAPYWVNYHMEHHLLVYVPCYRLPLFHRFLKDNGYAERMQLSRGYLQVLKEVVSDNADDANSGRRALGTFGQGYTPEL